eukprot:CAMPEP_0197649380 /NCGR_PEP_ID=MMETSP1338-20131121/28318_1 /TAXON_ID=43686 ORGANISM="Pelagodinium beii, Strain RCC1491" /NCGR_SAMPLE_ID=MMETSP1338 /ASSEMBLY_ACC=CAM_ASM_000754 /LENGTH=749 /DNA_ID=CAMNT_0043223545 /DNA_START=41 /DNA_END=2290 /DNA_ORIENTATION=-
MAEVQQSLQTLSAMLHSQATSQTKPAEDTAAGALSTSASGSAEATSQIKPEEDTAVDALSTSASGSAEVVDAGQRKVEEDGRPQPHVEGEVPGLNGASDDFVDVKLPDLCTAPAHERNRIAAILKSTSFDLSVYRTILKEDMGKKVEECMDEDVTLEDYLQDPEQVWEHFLEWCFANGLGQEITYSWAPEMPMSACPPVFVALVSELPCRMSSAAEAELKAFLQTEYKVHIGKLPASKRASKSFDDLLKHPQWYFGALAKFADTWQGDTRGDGANTAGASGFKLLDVTTAPRHEQSSIVALLRHPKFNMSVYEVALKEDMNKKVEECMDDEVSLEDYLQDPEHVWNHFLEWCRANGLEQKSSYSWAPEMPMTACPPKFVAVVSELASKMSGASEERLKAFLQEECEVYIAKLPASKRASKTLDVLRKTPQWYFPTLAKFAEAWKGDDDLEVARELPSEGGRRVIAVGEQEERSRSRTPAPRAPPAPRATKPEGQSVVVTAETALSHFSNRAANFTIIGTLHASCESVKTIRKNEQQELSMARGGSKGRGKGARGGSSNSRSLTWHVWLDEQQGPVLLEGWDALAATCMNVVHEITGWKSANYRRQYWEISNVQMGELAENNVGMRKKFTWSKSTKLTLRADLPVVVANAIKLPRRMVAELDDLFNLSRGSKVCCESIVHFDTGVIDEESRDLHLSEDNMVVATLRGRHVPFRVRVGQVVQFFNASVYISNNHKVVLTCWDETAIAIKSS